MIDLYYCPDTGADHAAKVVTKASTPAQNPALPSPANHHHTSDDTMHACTLVAGVNEDIPSHYPWTCGDGITVVNDVDEWLNYLKTYIPA